MTHVDQDTLRMDCCATLSVSPLDYSSPPLPYCECMVSLSLVLGDSFTLSGRNNSARDHRGRKERVFYVNLAKARSYGLRGTSHRIGMEDGQFFFLDFFDDDDYKEFLPFLRVALDSLNLKDRPKPPVKPKEDYLVVPNSSRDRENSAQDNAKENHYLSLRYSKMDFKERTSKKNLSEDDKDSDNEGYEELRSPIHSDSNEPISCSNRPERTEVRFKSTQEDRSPVRTDPRGPEIPPRSQQSLRNPIYNQSIDKRWSPSPERQKRTRNADSPKNQDLISPSSSPSSSSFLSSSNAQILFMGRMTNTLPVPERKNTEQCQIKYSNHNRFQTFHHQPVTQSNDKKSTRNGDVFTLPVPDRPLKNNRNNGISESARSSDDESNLSPKSVDSTRFADRARSLTPTLPTNVNISSGSNRSDPPRFHDQQTNVFVARETNRSGKYEIGNTFDDSESTLCLSVSMPLLNPRTARDKPKGNNFTSNNSLQRQVSEPQADPIHNKSLTSVSRNISFTILDGRNINVSRDGVAVIFEMEMSPTVISDVTEVGRKRNDSRGGRTCVNTNWACSVCTYHNECSTDLCIICNASRLD